MQGTIEELVERGLKVNGIFVDKSMLAVLVRCGIGECVGEGPKPARGRTAKVWKFEDTAQVKVSINYKD